VAPVQVDLKSMLSDSTFSDYIRLSNTTYATSHASVVLSLRSIIKQQIQAVDELIMYMEDPYEALPAAVCCLSLSERP
jgi:hypothetical protein